MQEEKTTLQFVSKQKQKNTPSDQVVLEIVEGNTEPPQNQKQNKTNKAPTSTTAFLNSYLSLAVEAYPIVNFGRVVNCSIE